MRHGAGVQRIRQGMHHAAGSARDTAQQLRWHDAPVEREEVGILGRLRHDRSVQRPWPGLGRPLVLVPGSVYNASQNALMMSSGQFAAFGNVTLGNVTAGLAVSVLVRLDAMLPSMAAGQTLLFLSMITTPPGSVITLGLSWGAISGQPLFVASVNDKVTINAGTAPQAVWTHVVLSVDVATGNATLYVNGSVPAGQQTNNPTSLNGIASAVTTATFTANTLGNMAFDMPFNGAFADVQLYNAPLSTAQVAGIYGGNTSGGCTRPVCAAGTYGDGATCTSCSGNFSSLAGSTSSSACTLVVLSTPNNFGGPAGGLLHLDLYPTSVASVPLLYATTKLQANAFCEFKGYGKSTAYTTGTLTNSAQVYVGAGWTVPQNMSCGSAICYIYNYPWAQFDFGASPTVLLTVTCMPLTPPPPSPPPLPPPPSPSPPLPCAAGTYGSGGSACSSCPAGFNSSAGATLASNCTVQIAGYAYGSAVGFYASSSTWVSLNTTCTRCAANSDSAGGNATSCIPTASPPPPTPPPPLPVRAFHSQQRAAALTRPPPFSAASLSPSVATAAAAAGHRRTSWQRQLYSAQFCHACRVDRQHIQRLR